MYDPEKVVVRTGLEHKNRVDKNERLPRLERRLVKQYGLLLEPMPGESAAIVRELMSEHGCHVGREIPESGDPPAVFEAFGHGVPNLNAIRDNVREPVYHHNCLGMDRADALPKAPERMAVRMARHVYFYLRSRGRREGRLEQVVGMMVPPGSECRHGKGMKEETAQTTQPVPGIHAQGEARRRNPLARPQPWREPSAVSQAGDPRSMIIGHIRNHPLIHGRFGP